MRFATRVTSFGVYEEDARASYRAGDAVLVYAEPRGFRSASVPGPDDAPAQWRVQLRLTVALHDLVRGTEAGRWGPDDVTHVTRSLVHDPPILLLDEPFTGLDRPGAERLSERLRRLHGEGRTLVLVSHDFAHAAEVSDRAVVLSRGRIAHRLGASEIDAGSLERATLDVAGDAA